MSILCMEMAMPLVHERQLTLAHNERQFISSGWCPAAKQNCPHFLWQS